MRSSTHLQGGLSGTPICDQSKGLIDARFSVRYTSKVAIALRVWESIRTNAGESQPCWLSPRFFMPGMGEEKHQGFQHMDLGLCGGRHAGRNRQRGDHRDRPCGKRGEYVGHASGELCELG